MNPETFLPLLAELLAKSALILTAAMLISRAWLRASAAQRHLVWCAALGAVLLLPLTRLHEPRWSVPIQRVRVELPRVKRNDLPPIETASTARVTASTARVTASTARVTAAPRAAAPNWMRMDWKQALLVVWMLGSGLLFTARLLASAQLAWLRRTLRPIDDARTQRLAAKVFAALGIRRKIELRHTPAGSVPLTWGTLRPVLGLPSEALAWSDARLRAALHHEAGHIVRRDHLTRSLAQLACIFYWPNPLVWLAARQLRAAQEEATDDLVLCAGTAPEEYAAQLFDVARTLVLRRSFDAGAVAMASPSTLERRMLAIVDAERDRRPLSRRALGAGMLAVMLMFGICSAAQLQGADPVPTKAAGAAVSASPVLELLPIRTEDIADDSSAKHFALHLPIKVRAGLKVDAPEVAVQVIFYDTIEGQKIVPTTATVKSEWMSPPADWAESGTEELVVEYQLPKPANGGDRNYFGYTVRLYYRQQLQISTAEPQQLLQLYPAESETRAAESSAALPLSLPGEVARAEGTQILIEAKFIEISGEPADLPSFLKDPASNAKDGLRATLSDADANAAVRTLNQIKGLDLLSAPRVTTRSGQKAVIEVIREFRYPTEWDKDAGSGGWTGKNFATKNVGVTFAVTPEAKSDGTISLRLVPEVTEFEGYKNLDAKPGDAATLDRDESATGRRREPVFSTRKIDTQVTAKSGDTIVLGGLRRVDVQMVEDKVPILGDVPVIGRLFTSTEERQIKRNLVVFVTARIVAAGESPAEKSSALTFTGGALNVTGGTLDIAPPKPGEPALPAGAAIGTVNADKTLTFTTGATGAITISNPKPGEPALPAGTVIGTVNADRTLTLANGTTGVLNITTKPGEPPLPAGTVIAGSTADGRTTIIGANTFTAPKAGAAGTVSANTTLTKEGNGTLILSTKVEADPAAGVIVPRVEFREAKLSEAVEFLAAKGRAAGLTPFNIVVTKAPQSEPVLTLSLTDVPLTDAIRYVAELAGLKVRREAGAFVLESAPAPAPK